MTGPGNVLIVDDDEVNRALLNDLIVALGHNPVLAENGMEALASMEKHPPDLVLLDIIMPGMDGYEVLDRLKSDDDLHNIPVIMISALDEMKSVVRCIEKGADDYLVKPFNPTLLRARIGAALEKKHLHDREQRLHAELKENYEALQKAEQARYSLSRMIVHDLNNPLTAVLGFAELLLAKSDQDSLDREFFSNGLQHIYSAAKEISSLIKGILDVSKLEAGQMPVSMATLNASELIKALSKQFAPEAEKRGVRLSFESESDAIMARADKELQSRVMENLLTNVLKNSAGATEVALSVKRDGGSVLFCVADDGPGIPAKYRDKIFGKFFQVETAAKGQKYGVGLGLTFCKMAVEAQGGSIWVESEEGRGATFTVRLEAC